MDDLTNGGAPAPADTPAVAEAPNAQEPAPSHEPTPRSAIDRAFEAVEKGEQPPEKVEKPTEAAPVDGRERNPDGTFKAKEAPKDGEPEKVEQPTAEQHKPGIGEAPSRFSADAKAAWNAVPDAVKGEVHRALREAEQGIEKYRTDATTYTTTFKPFVEMAQRSQIDPARQLASYVNIDMMLAKDFNAGIAQIFQNKGQDLKAWAAQIANGQSPQPSQQDNLIAELRKEIADLRQGVGSVTQTIEQQRGQQITSGIDNFIKTLPEAERPLFTELDAEIAAHLSADPSITLADAFAKAKSDAQAKYARMFGTAPASDATASTVPQTHTPAPPPQKQNGHLQISGAPGGGVTPPSRVPASSTRAALDSAFAELGIG